MMRGINIGNSIPNTVFIDSDFLFSFLKLGCDVYWWFMGNVTVSSSPSLFF